MGPRRDFSQVPEQMYGRRQLSLTGIELCCKISRPPGDSPRPCATSATASTNQSYLSRKTVLPRKPRGIDGPLGRSWRRFSSAFSIRSILGASRNQARLCFAPDGTPCARQSERIQEAAVQLSQRGPCLQRSQIPIPLYVPALMAAPLTRRFQRDAPGPSPRRASRAG